LTAGGAAGAAGAAGATGVGAGGWLDVVTVGWTGTLTGTSTGGA